MGVGVGGGRGDEEGRVQWLAPSHLFLFNVRKAERTRGFSVKPVKLVLSSSGLFSSVFFGKLAIQRSGLLWGFAH